MFGQSTLIWKYTATVGRSMENERSFVDNPRRMYLTKRQTWQERVGQWGESQEAAPGEQEITSPDVRSFGFRAPRYRSWEKPATPSESECKRGKRLTGYEQGSGKGSRENHKKDRGPSMSKTTKEYWGMKKESRIGRSEYTRHSSLSKYTLGMQPV